MAAAGPGATDRRGRRRGRARRGRAVHEPAGVAGVAGGGAARAPAPPRRDGSHYDPQLERWALQEDDFYERERPAERADIVLAAGAHPAGSAGPA